MGGRLQEAGAGGAGRDTRWNPGVSAPGAQRRTTQHRSWRKTSCSSLSRGYNTSARGEDEQGGCRGRGKIGIFSVFGQNWLNAELVVQLPTFGTSLRRGISENAV